MRTATLAIATTVLVSLLTVSESGVTSLESRSLVDDIVKGILEKLRPSFADLKIQDVNQTVRHPDLNATVIINKILIKNLDKFVIQNLKSNVVPLRLLNLTLTWSEIVASASYDLGAKFNVGGFSGPFYIHGKGDAKATLKDVFFTIGANLEMKNKALQIKPKGLFGFDLFVKRANVTVSSVMGSTEFGNALGVFLSNIIPDLVNTLKKPVFDAFQDDIIKIVNEILKGEKFYSDAPFDSPTSGDFPFGSSLNFLEDSSEEMSESF